MGWITNLFSRSKSAPLDDPEQLRVIVFKMASQGQTPQLLSFCRTNRKLIREQFDSWRKPPPEIAGDPDAMQAYIIVLVTVASLFAAQFNHTSLLESLQGPAGDPLADPNKHLETARKLLGEDDPESAQKTLEQILPMLDDLSGNAVDFLRALVTGSLAQVHYEYGRIDQARWMMLDTLRQCEAVDDLEGRIAWHGNLFELYRYTGANKEAADQAQKAADLLTTHAPTVAPQAIAAQKEILRWRKRAEMVAAGEPLLRIIARTPEGALELNELAGRGITQAQFFFERNRRALGGSARKVAKGKALGEQGQFQKALEQFQAAAAIDPLDPDPHYQIAATHMHLGAYAKSADAFQQTENLAPGWFSCRSGLWLAVQFMRGAIQPLAMPNLWALEVGEPEPRRAERRAEALLQTYPDLALAHFHLSRSLQAQKQPVEALAAAETGLIHAVPSGDPDIHTRILVQLATLLPAKDSRRKTLLQEAVSLDGNRNSAAGARMILEMQG